MLLTCTICRELMKETDDICATICGHVYHHKCLTPWLERSQSCPQCRELIAETSILCPSSGKAVNGVNQGGGDDTRSSRLWDENKALKISLESLNLCSATVFCLTSFQDKFPRTVRAVGLVYLNRLLGIIIIGLQIFTSTIIWPYKTYHAALPAILKYFLSGHLLRTLPTSQQRNPPNIMYLRSAVLYVAFQSVQGLKRDLSFVKNELASSQRTVTDLEQQLEGAANKINKLKENNQHLSQRLQKFVSAIKKTAAERHIDSSFIIYDHQEKLALKIVERLARLLFSLRAELSAENNDVVTRLDEALLKPMEDNTTLTEAWRDIWNKNVSGEPCYHESQYYYGEFSNSEQTKETRRKVPVQSSPYAAKLAAKHINHNFWTHYLDNLAKHYTAIQKSDNKWNYDLICDHFMGMLNIMLKNTALIDEASLEVVQTTLDAILKMSKTPPNIHEAMPYTSEAFPAPEALPCTKAMLSSSVAGLTTSEAVSTAPVVPSIPELIISSEVVSILPEDILTTAEAVPTLPNVMTHTFKPAMDTLVTLLPNTAVSTLTKPASTTNTMFSTTTSMLSTLTSVSSTPKSVASTPKLMPTTSNAVLTTLKTVVSKLKAIPNSPKAVTSTFKTVSSSNVNKKQDAASYEKPVIRHIVPLDTANFRSIAIPTALKAAPTPIVSVLPKSMPSNSKTVPNTPVKVPTTPKTVPTTPKTVPTTPKIIPTTPVPSPRPRRIQMPREDYTTSTTLAAIPTSAEEAGAFKKEKTTLKSIPTVSKTVPNSPKSVPNTPKSVPTTAKTAPTTPVPSPRPRRVQRLAPITETKQFAHGAAPYAPGWLPFASGAEQFPLRTAPLPEAMPFAPEVKAFVPQVFPTSATSEVVSTAPESISTSRPTPAPSLDLLELCREKKKKITPNILILK